MGCWDVFCFACDNPCHSLFKNYIEGIENDYKEYINSKNNKSYKIDSYYKNLFQKIGSDPKFFTKLKNLYKTTQWLNNNTFLTVDDKIIHGCKEVSCNTNFRDSKGNVYFQTLNSYQYNEISEKVNCGVFLHTDCWKFIKTHYKINLKYSDLPAIYKKNEYNKINSKINYGVMEKYWVQDFNFFQVSIDSNEYVCENPLKNLKNQSRIKKILTQLKLNTDPKRIGPAVSATFYPDKTIKYGLDGGLWIKSAGKWVKIKEPVKSTSITIDYNKTDKKILNYLNKIVCIGEPTNIPIFILNVKSDKKMKKTYKIDLVGTEKQINHLNK